MPCKCKSRCKTIRCECVKNKTKCDSSLCSCSTCLCENIISNNEINFLTVIKNQLHCQATNRRDTVLKYRNNIDLYTGLSKELIICPHVDHIIETQMLINAIASSIKDKLKPNMIEPLKKSINQNYNYNVTHGKINISKGACIKSFLQDGLYNGLPLRSVIIGKYCDKYVLPISNAMLDSYSNVHNYLESCRVDDNYISDNNSFASIADNLAEIIEKMDLDIDKY